MSPSNANSGEISQLFVRALRARTTASEYTLNLSASNQLTKDACSAITQGADGLDYIRALEARTAEWIEDFPLSKGKSLRFLQNDLALVADRAMACGQPDTARAALASGANPDLFVLSALAHKQPASLIEDLCENAGVRGLSPYGQLAAGLGFGRMKDVQAAYDRGAKLDPGMVAALIDGSAVPSGYRERHQAATVKLFSAFEFDAGDRKAIAENLQTPGGHKFLAKIAAKENSSGGRSLSE